MLCRHGKKDWNGSDPKCAFDEEGKFREENWNCFLLTAVRGLMNQYRMKMGSVPMEYVGGMKTNIKEFYTCHMETTGEMRKGMNSLVLLFLWVGTSPVDAQTHSTYSVVE